MLIIFSYIYKAIWIIRKSFYASGIFKTKRLPYPVICVGNITAGGTGKTPATIALAGILQEGAHRVAVLTRGYKRKSGNPVVVVTDGNSILSTPHESGDEPYLIASALKNVPVIVGADRYRSGLHAIDTYGANLFILDDGYQHLKLHRDIDILLIDASNPFGNRYLLPKGILREPLQGISRADCIIISRANEGDRQYVRDLVRSCNHEAPVFEAVYRAVNIMDMNGNSLGINHIMGKGILLFSGIASPHSFRKSVEDIGGLVKGELVFPDHYWYRESDMKKVLKEASELAVDAIVTTAKDAVRISKTGMPDKVQGNKDIIALQVEMDIDNGFGKWIKEQIPSLGIL